VLNAKEVVPKWGKSWVDKVIVCFGTVDIFNMEYRNHDVSCVVEEISCGVQELKKVCDEWTMKLVYVTLC